MDETRQDKCETIMDDIAYLMKQTLHLKHAATSAPILLHYPSLMQTNCRNCRCRHLTSSHVNGINSPNDYQTATFTARIGKNVKK